MLFRSIGHTRTSIYLSNLLLVFSASLMIMAAWLVGALSGIPALGLWAMDISSLLLYLLVSMMFTAAFCAIFTLASMVSANKAATVVASLLIFAGMLISASIMYEQLAEPELIRADRETVVVFDNTLNPDEPLPPNPRYLSGTKREAIMVVFTVLPTGQSLQISMLQASDYMLMLLSSVSVTVLVSSAGIALFRKKDLK